MPQIVVQHQGIQIFSSQRHFGSPKFSCSALVLGLAYVFQTFSSQPRKMHFPRAILPTLKLMSETNGNICLLNVYFFLYWLLKHLSGCLIIFPAVSVIWEISIYICTQLVTHISILISYLKHITMQACIILHLYTPQHYKSFQQDVDKKSPSKVQAIPDPYLLGSCIAGVFLELLYTLVNGTLISVKGEKRAKGFINTIETKASNS